jgi:virginiamycin B lyase
MTRFKQHPVRALGWHSLLIVAVLLTSCTGTSQPSALGSGAQPTAIAQRASTPPSIAAPSLTAPAAPPSAISPSASPAPAPPTAPALQEYAAPSGSHPHDVAPAPDGTVWYTAQGSGELGRLDPATGATHHIALGEGSAPHGVIVGPDGAPWITDGGLNAIVRVNPRTRAVKVYRLPASAADANLNTAVFDRAGRLWFTGQSGFYGRLDPAGGRMRVWRAPGGFGPYGITVTPRGDVYYASLAGSHIARIDVRTGRATRIEPPTRTREHAASGRTPAGASG